MPRADGLSDCLQDEDVKKRSASNQPQNGFGYAMQHMLHIHFLITQQSAQSVQPSASLSGDRAVGSLNRAEKVSPPPDPDCGSNCRVSVSR